MLAKSLAHGQQSLFWPYLCRGVVVKPQVADCRKEHGVGLHAGFVGLGRIRIADKVDGMSATNGLLIIEFMIKLLGNGVEHPNPLLHDFRTDAVAGENGNVQFHSLLSLVY